MGTRKILLEWRTSHIVTQLQTIQTQSEYGPTPASGRCIHEIHTEPTELLCRFAHWKSELGIFRKSEEKASPITNF